MYPQRFSYWLEKNFRIALSKYRCKNLENIHTYKRSRLICLIRLRSVKIRAAKAHKITWKNI